MSGYLLDTNILSDLIRNPSGAAAKHLAQKKASEICTSIVVAAELRYGCARKGSAKLSARVEALLETLTILPLESPADREYGRIRAELEAAGEIIGNNDLLIAAQAAAQGLILVTDNMREFSRVVGLTLENWLKEL